MVYMYVADQSISLSKMPVDHKVHLTSSSQHKNALNFFCIPTHWVKKLSNLTIENSIYNHYTSSSKDEWHILAKWNFHVKQRFLNVTNVIFILLVYPFGKVCQPKISSLKWRMLCAKFGCLRVQEKEIFEIPQSVNILIFCDPSNLIFLYTKMLCAKFG